MAARTGRRRRRPPGLGAGAALDRRRAQIRRGPGRLPAPAPARNVQGGCRPGRPAAGARPLPAASGRTAARPWPIPCAWPSGAAFAFAELDELFPDGGSELETLVRQKLDARGAGPAERERALQELQVIRRTGAAAYFLIAGEIADYCRQQRIFFSLRGSGGASFVLFLLGMSRIDPLRHGLLFERFVNSLRDDLPDIDVDIDSSRRRRGVPAGCSRATRAGRPSSPATSSSAPARRSTKRPAPSASIPTRPTP